MANIKYKPVKDEWEKQTNKKLSLCYELGNLRLGTKISVSSLYTASNSTLSQKGSRDAVFWETIFDDSGKWFNDEEDIDLKAAWEKFE